jgi:peptide/nickel transport system ATP-binding protein
MSVDQRTDAIRMTQDHAVDVKNLTTRHRTKRGEVEILTDVSLHIDRGQVLGVVGESGCGKSTLALTLAGLLSSRTARLSGSVLLDGIELVGLRERQLRKLRGSRVGFVPQDPMEALNPTVTVGKQLMEAPIEHLGMSKAEAKKLAIELLDMVRLPGAGKLLSAYPHHLSGGMRQRVMIAIAMSCKPTLVVADEPTTALDVTVQAEVLRLFRELCSASGSALLVISHDLSVVAGIADEIAVLYAGEVIEWASTEEVIKTPAHPYTHALLNAVPDLDDPDCRWRALESIPGKPPAVDNRPSGCRFGPRCSFAGTDNCLDDHRELRAVTPGHLARTSHPIANDSRTKEAPALLGFRRPQGPSATVLETKLSPILALDGLTKTYQQGRGELFQAVANASLEILPGQTYGLVGESGSGKSTLAHCVLQLARPYDGQITFEGNAIDKLSGQPLRAMRRRMQIIFQDARNSMDSRMTIGAAIAEPLRIHGGVSRSLIKDRVVDRLEAVGLNAAMLDRYPRQCSGGELQRVCIARALILQPGLLVCDEAVTSLDVSSRAQVINLLRELQVRENLAMLFISHDFATIKAVSDVVGVMRQGVLIEQGPAEQVLTSPKHEYTRELLAAVPRLHAAESMSTRG